MDDALDLHKIEMYSGNHRIRLSIPHDFLSGITSTLFYMHTHVKFEVISIQYRNSENTNKIIITPPLYPHYTFRDEKGTANALVFQFTIEELKDDTLRQSASSSGILKNFLTLNKTFEVFDTFNGHERISSITRELVEKPVAYAEKVTAEFLAFLIDLAREMPTENNSIGVNKRSIDERRVDIIEDFFIDNYMRLDCCRKNLADLLYLSERYVSHIIKSTYKLTFSELLFRTRMEIAEGLRNQSKVSAKRMAHNVGYASTSAFLTAYKKYYGHPYKAKVIEQS